MARAELLSALLPQPPVLNTGCMRERLKMQERLHDDSQEPLQRPSQDVRELRRSKGLLAVYVDQDTVKEAVALIPATQREDVTLDEIVQAAHSLTVAATTVGVRLQTAKHFGFVRIVKQNDGQNIYRLTELGKRLLNPLQEQEARVEGFLNVPLYGEVFRRYYRTGGYVSDKEGLDATIEQLGAPLGQIRSIRQYMIRSAAQAGMLDKKSGRLQIPPNITFPNLGVLLSDIPEGSDAPREVGETSDIQAEETDSPIQDEVMQDMSLQQATPSAHISNTSTTEPLRAVSMLQGRDLGPIFAAVFQDAPDLSAPFVEEDWDEWMSLLSTAYHRGKRRIRAQSVLQSENDDGQEKA